MIEKIKSVVLTILVFISLVLSYFLAYSPPKFDTVVQTDYVRNEVIGTQAELANVLYPEQVILHSGNGTHTLLPLNQQFYHMIYDDFLKRKIYDGFHQTSSSTSWDYIRSQSKGIELRFKEAVPLHVLQSILQIKEDTPTEDNLISRMMIYIVRNTDEVRTFFFSNRNEIVYESVRVDISAINVRKYVAFGASLTNYHMSTWCDSYLPDKPITLPKMQAKYTEFTADQLKRSLFVDPSMMRYLTGRDGTQIYTDGKRGLQLKYDKHWMNYSDPISIPVESRNDIKENLLSSIQFINQHGGWNGSFVYSQMTPTQGTGPQTLLFRQYMDNYPLISLNSNPFGYIKLTLQKATVSAYERSLVNIDSKNTIRSDASLPGGSDLDNLLNNYVKKLQVVAVFPAYQVNVIKDGKVDLIPRWAVELKDGTNEFIY
jgi:regulatory protein YycH of two-component signal transduction system YycFG